MLRSLAPGVVALVLAAATGTGANGQVDSIDWPAGLPGGAGPFTGSTIARLSGDFVADLLLASDGELYVGDALQFFNCFRSLAVEGSVIDVATLPTDGLSSPDDRDRVVISSTTGLWLLRETAQGDVITAIDATAAWRGIKRIVVADLDGDGDDDLVVLKGNGKATDSKLQQPGGSWADSTEYEWSGNQEVLDLGLAELDGDPSQPELVVDDRRALRLFGAGPTALATFASLRHDHDRMAIVHDAMSGDAVAWVTAASASASDPLRHLFLVTLAGGADFCATTGDALGPALSGNFGDGSDADLAFLNDGESELLLLERQPSEPFFDFSSAHGTAHPLPGATTAVAGRPCASDLGAQGMIAAPLASAEQVALLLVPLIPAELGYPDFEHDATCADKEELDGFVADVTFVADYPDAALLAAQGGWHVDCTVWREAGGMFGSFVPGYAMSCRTPITSALQATGHLVDVTFACADDSDLYYVQVRLVQIDPISNLIVATRPALLGAYSASEGLLEELDEMGFCDVPGWTEGYEKVHLCGGGPSPPRVGGFIRIRRMPPSIPPPAPPPPAPTDVNCSQ